MKKILFLIFVSAFSFLKAEYDIDMQARVIAFFPTGDHFSNIYGNCLGCYEIEASTPFQECFNAWANVDFFCKKGSSDQLHDFTRVSVANFSLGLKYPYPIFDNLMIYIGIGPSFGGVWIDNHIHSHRHKTSKFAMGGVLKTGLCYDIDCRIFLDLFFDYLYQPCFSKDIGGSKLGLGVGYKF